MPILQMPDLCLVSEVADKLRISEMTVYRYIDAGKLKAHRLGKAYRITREELERFLETTETC